MAVRRWIGVGIACAVIAAGYVLVSRGLRAARAKARNLTAIISENAAKYGLNPNATMKDCVVLLTARAQAAPARIVLTWVPVPKNLGFTVTRRDKDGSNWSALATLPPEAATYSDATAVIGKAYEYKVSTQLANLSAGQIRAMFPWLVSIYEGAKRVGFEIPEAEFGHLYGYALSGIEVPIEDARGKVILLVEASKAGPLAAEIGRLEQDLIGDGWIVIRHDVPPTEPMAAIREQVRQDYVGDPAHVKSLFILGHLPVPYSGNFAPDGHPNRIGAQPADVYYGSIDGTWTDTAVTTTGNKLPENKNVPGDGRFDQSEIPGKIWLQIGRVDFSNLPAFAPLTETDLLRRYLEKDHAYRDKAYTVKPGCVAEDALGSPLALAPLGYSLGMAAVHTCTPMFGADGITLVRGTWLKTLCDTGSQWAFAFAGSSRDHCGNIVSTRQLVKTDPKVVFAGLFGSFFGDWPVRDDVMRAMVATKTYTLGCVFASSPPVNLNAMSLGETAGYGVWYSQHAELCPGNCAGRVHTELMGDPTLRMHVVAPPVDLVVTASGSNVRLGWKPSTDQGVIGYHVYRAASMNGPFRRITSEPAAECVFTDTMEEVGKPVYMVRAVKLETSASGSYYNGSQGVFATLGIK